METIVDFFTVIDIDVLANTISRRPRSGRGKGFCKGRNCPRIPVVSIDRSSSLNDDPVCQSSLLQILRVNNAPFFGDLTEASLSLGATTYSTNTNAEPPVFDLVATKPEARNRTDAFTLDDRSFVAISGNGQRFFTGYFDLGIYERKESECGAAWVFVQELAPSCVTSVTGLSVSSNGRSLAVGNSWSVDTLSHYVSVYVFSNDESSWTKKGNSVSSTPWW